MAIERVTCFPNEGTPEVIPGDPQQGDIIRIVGTQNYQRYKEPRSFPPPVKSWDAYDFKLRFTADERKAIRTAAKTSPDVEDFMDLLDTAAATGTRIKADDALLNAGLSAMEFAGLIGAGRAAEIVG